MLATNRCENSIRKTKKKACRVLNIELSARCFSHKCTTYPQFTFIPLLKLKHIFYFSSILPSLALTKLQGSLDENRYITDIMLDRHPRIQTAFYFSSCCKNVIVVFLRVWLAAFQDYAHDFTQVFVVFRLVRWKIYFFPSIQYNMYERLNLYTKFSKNAHLSGIVTCAEFYFFALGNDYVAFEEILSHVSLSTLLFLLLDKKFLINENRVRGSRVECP